MSNQSTRGTESSGNPINVSASSNSNAASPEAQRPVVVSRPRSTGATGAGADTADGTPTNGASKGTARKAASTKTSTKVKKRSVQKSGDSRGGGTRRGEGKSRLSRKQIIIGLIVFVVIFDVTILLIGVFGNSGGAKVPPNPDPITLIQSQMTNNKTIAEIGYDAALTFSEYPDLAIVNTASLKSISNNLLKAGGGADGTDSLYDEQIVGRVLKFNSDWANYLNQGDQTVLASVQAGSPAQTKLAELGAGSLVAYHRLAIGEIRHTGKNYYLITRASYTLTKAGQLDIRDDVFVYKLVVDGNTMLIVDFEQIPMSAVPEQPQQDQATEPSETPTEESAGDESDGEGEGGDESGGEGEGEGENSEEEDY